MWVYAKCTGCLFVWSHELFLGLTSHTPTEKYASGMYWVAFLLFWAIAVAFNSSAGLLVAAYSHIFIWAHFYATEKPDMDYLYGSQSTVVPYTTIE